jgi:hypothetical protein
MNPPITNPTPKQEFLESAAACKAHRELMQNPALRRSFNAALLHHQRRLTSAVEIDGNAAAAYFLKIKGAQEFLDILINLAEPATPASGKADLNKLNYKA